MTKKLVVVSAGLSQPSSTRLLADRLTPSTVDRLREDGPSTSSGTDVEVTVVESPPFTVLRSGHITYMVGDFFDLTPKNAGRFDLVYDRAALIAMPEDRRPAYVRQLRSLLDPGAQILLIALDYDPEQMSGPPHAVPESEVRTLFAGHTIEKLQEVDCLEDEPRFKERGLKWMKEIVYYIR